MELRDVSPSLASLRGTSVALPGLTEAAADRSDASQAEANSHSGGGGGEVVVVQSVVGTVLTLATKTRPKKVVFLGSDGRTYPYLLKVRRLACV